VGLCASLLRCKGTRSKRLIFLQDSPIGSTKEEQYLHQAAEVRSFLKRFKMTFADHFHRIEVLSNDRNLGPYRTCQVALDHAFTTADFAVFVEDDVVLAADALRWFDYCHEHLIGREDIWAAVGESRFFDSGGSSPALDLVERLRRIADNYELVNKYGTIP
jgi:hypothetical protein